MGHSVIKCDQCGSFVMEGAHGTWECDCGWSFVCPNTNTNSFNGARSIIGQMPLTVNQEDAGSNPVAHPEFLKNKKI